MQLAASFRHFLHSQEGVTGRGARTFFFGSSLLGAQQPPTAKKTTQNSTQPTPGTEMSQMPGMQMAGNGQINMQPENFIQEIMAHNTSGTSAEPDSTPAPMLMTIKAFWTLMFHANVFILDEQQSSARGGDKFFSTNWFMGMAKHKAGPGVFTIRSMLTLEPATITERRYPLLFQQGETAFGVPSPMDSILTISSWSLPRFTISNSATGTALALLCAGG